MKRLGTVITLVIGLLGLGACAEHTQHPAATTGPYFGTSGGMMGGHGY